MPHHRIGLLDALMASLKAAAKANLLERAFGKSRQSY
jgi:hypothetical protein